MRVETNVIVLFVSKCKYKNYRVLIDRLTTKGYIVITIVSNIDTIHVRRFKKAIDERIDKIVTDYTKRSIEIVIDRISIISHGDGCLNLIELIKRNFAIMENDIFDKILSENRTKSKYFGSNLKIVLIDPSNSSDLFNSSFSSNEMDVFIVLTKNNKNVLQNVPQNVRSIDRITDISSDDITISSRKIDEKTKLHDRMKSLVDHIDKINRSSKN